MAKFKIVNVSDVETIRDLITNQCVDCKESELYRLTSKAADLTRLVYKDMPVFPLARTECGFCRFHEDPSSRVVTHADPQARFSFCPPCVVDGGFEWRGLVFSSEGWTEFERSEVASMFAAVLQEAIQQRHFYASVTMAMAIDMDNGTSV